MDEPFVVDSQPRYVLVQEPGKPPSITCRTCGKTSYHPTDIAQRYCGHCHVFHEDASCRRG